MLYPLGNADLVIRLNRMRELGLNLDIDTNHLGYRIKNDFGRNLSPVFKTVVDVINALDVMYNAISEFQTIQ